MQAPRPEVRTVIDHKRLQHKIQANAFGALREMEYFSMRTDKFRFGLSFPPRVRNENNGHHDSTEAAESKPLYEVQWERDGRPYPVNDCPWDTCYLIGGRNDMMGSKCLTISELYQMAAEQIFLDFEPSPFGNDKRMIRVNMKDQYLDYMKDDVRDKKTLLYYRFMSRRFSTFGLSQIYFDRERNSPCRQLSFGAAVDSGMLDGCALGADEVIQMATEDLVGAEQGVTDTQLPEDPHKALGFEAIARATLVMSDHGEKTYTDQIAEEAGEYEQKVRSRALDPFSEQPFKDWTDRHEVLLKDTRPAPAIRAWPCAPLRSGPKSCKP